jgi:hypothetical protein
MADLVALGAHGLRKAACGRWAFSSALAQMSLCLSPHHSALQFSEFGSVGEALTLPPGDSGLFAGMGRFGLPASGVQVLDPPARHV